ncbi:DUF1295 domain-containing protein [Dietzia sp.]|uniref:DUF1295 domain-containing protein n=1 Tax=Dietzia sp. TaxID=1871616 RepID=UPI002FDA70E1
MTSLATFALVYLVTFLALLALQLATFAVGRRIGRFNVVDVSWGVGFALSAGLLLVLRLAGFGSAASPDAVAVAIAVAAVLWGTRHSIHVGRKPAGKGEDPRYVDMLERSGGYRAGGSLRSVVVIRKVFLLQSAAQWFVSLPLQALVVGGRPSGAAAPVAVLGLALWVAGFVVEAVGDAQLEAFKRDPHRPKIMDRGLWAWTRHPNYFGDACVWWGLWLAAAATGPAAWTFAAPLAMTYLLVWGSGARLLEKTMSKREG